MVNRVFAWGVIGAFIIWGISLIADNNYIAESDDAAPAQAAPAQAKAAPHLPERIEPEMLIRFPNGSLACLSKDSLQETISHALSHEKTKAEAMMVENGGDCVMLSPSLQVKVISVEYNDPSSDIGLLELVGPKIISSQGAWALSIGAIPVKSEHRKAGRH